MLLEEVLLADICSGDTEFPAIRVIKIRADGFEMQHGLTNRFNMIFPNELKHHIAPEQFFDTMHSINSKLNKMKSLICTCHYVGLLFCLCTCGISLIFSRLFTCITVREIQKMLEHENEEIYNDLGVDWHITKDKICKEYILVISIKPKLILSEL